MSDYTHPRRLYEVVCVDAATNSITDWLVMPARDRAEALRHGRNLLGSPLSQTRARLVRPAGRYPMIVPD